MKTWKTTSVRVPREVYDKIRAFSKEHNLTYLEAICVLVMRQRPSTTTRSFVTAFSKEHNLTYLEAICVLVMRP